MSASNPKFVLRSMPTEDSESELQIALRQRDYAICSALLALVVSLALLASNLGPDLKTQSTFKIVNAHLAILAKNESVLHDNEAELFRDIAALDAIKKAPNR